MFIVPRPGLSFRDPHTHIRVPPEGMEVPDGSLDWDRIIADGDAIVRPQVTRAQAASRKASGSAKEGHS